MSADQWHTVTLATDPSIKEASMLFVSILEGQSAESARPIFVTHDRRVVDAVGSAIAGVFGHLHPAIAWQTKTESDRAHKILDSMATERALVKNVSYEQAFSEVIAFEPELLGIALAHPIYTEKSDRVGKLLELGPSQRDLDDIAAREAKHKNQPLTPSA